MNQIDPKLVEKISKDYKLAKELVEIHLNALQIAQELQNYDSNLILFGGTAAQFYIKSDLQRTSLDVDLITNYSYAKINEVMQGFFDKTGIKQIKTKDLVSTYGTRFGIPLDLTFSKGTGKFQHHVKVEIVSKSKEKINKIHMDECILHGINIGKFTMLPKRDLFAKKIITLDIDNLGIHKDKRNKNETLLSISKQISDIYRLYASFDKKDFENIGSDVFEQLDNETKVPKDKSKSFECLNRICGVTSSLSLVDTNKGTQESKDLTKGYKSLRDSYLPKDGILTFDQWGSLGWTFEHLFKSLSLDYQNSTNERALEHYRIREEYDKDNREKRVEVLQELSVYKDMPKPYKNRPLCSLFFKKDLMEGLK